MPKHAIDYSKSVIYKICCRDVSVKEEYIGSTTHIVSRRRQHKSNCQNEESNEFNFPVYAFIRDHGGWLNWDLVVIEAFPCKTSLEQRTRERYWLETLGAILNTQNPIRTRDDDLACWQQHYATHRTEKLEYRKEYDAAHRERNMEIVQCECGAEVCRAYYLSKHKRTAKHLKAMADK